MKTTINYAGYDVEPGKKLQALVPVEGTDVKIPITIINGVNDGKRIIVTSGVHSGEYSGIQCAIELAQEIQPEDVSGSLVIVHPCNPTGFFAHVSYIVPEDNKNMGRFLPGDPNGTLTDKICNIIAEGIILKGCDMLVDNHGGDLHERLSTFVFAPKGGEEAARQTSMEISKFMNVKYVVLSSGGFTNFAVTRGIPSIVLERGDRGLWTKEEVDYYKGDLLNIFKYFKLIKGEVSYFGPEPYIFNKCDMKYAPVSGCWYRNIELEQHVKEGQKLGEIRDFHGNVLHTVYAEYDAVIHSYWTSLAIKEGQLMTGYGA